MQASSPRTSTPPAWRSAPTSRSSTPACRTSSPPRAWPSTPRRRAVPRAAANGRLLRRVEGQIRRRGLGDPRSSRSASSALSLGHGRDLGVCTSLGADRDAFRLLGCDRGPRSSAPRRDPGGVLVVAEIVVLFAGVVARYVFHPPLVWSDELASILFLWLAMLGAVIALRRGEHMRMTALVARLGAASARLPRRAGHCRRLGFLVLSSGRPPSTRPTRRFITTPALEISNAWRAAALPGRHRPDDRRSALLRLRRAAAWRRRRFGARRRGGADRRCSGSCGPSFRSARQPQPAHLLRRLVGACVFAGVPIAFAFGLATFGYLALTTRVPMMVVVGRMDEGMSHLILLAVPLFVFLGLLIEMTGMARAMVRFLASLLGHVRGGLSYVLVGAMYLVSGISGSKAADMAAVAPALFPGDEGARRQARRPRRAALGHRRADRDRPAQPRAHHHRLGHGRLDRRAVHRRAAAGARARADALRRRAWRYRGEDLRHVVRATWRRDRQPSSSRCRRSPCRS